ncbi:MAG TPA: PKD domain-containing protein, partial [Flavobacteriales bacterium]|nr:PKD domain-containing protein [Flavobacteriales bacterium]
SDTSTLVHTVYPTPQASFTVAPNPGCENQDVYFTNTSTNATTYTWSFGDTTGSTAINPSHAYSATGFYSVTLMAYGAGGCGDTITVAPAVYINPTPTADFSYVNVTDPANNGTIVFTNQSTGAISYVWNFGNGNASTEENPTEKYNTFGPFLASLLATNQFGCTDTVVKEIIVDFYSGLFIPNAMYPGSDNFEVANFIPKGVSLKTFDITIYDDWGNLIWESTALDAQGRPTEYWDGTFKGLPVQQDSYVWKVVATFMDDSLWRGKEYSDGYFRNAGTITVIR